MTYSICVYMLDGERMYGRSKSPQIFTYTPTRVYGMWPWRGRPHTADSESLATKKGPYKPNLDLYCFDINLQSLKFLNLILNLLFYLTHMHKQVF
jgi:hypothetical protein